MIRIINQLISDGNITVFFEALIRAINDYGYNDDLSGSNSIGRELDKIYQQIYRQNVKKPNIFVRWYLRKKDREF